MTPEEALALVRTTSGLDAQSAEEVSGGWDSHTFAIDDTCIVRLPRAGEVAEAMERPRLLPGA